VSATSVDHWGLELLIVEVVCFFGALDSPVRSDIVVCLLTFVASDHGAVDHWAKLTITRGLTGQFGAHRTVR
jgi:hypothetical protein